MASVRPRANADGTTSFVVQWYDPETGKRKTATAPTKSAADALARDVDQESFLIKKGVVDPKAKRQVEQSSQSIESALNDFGRSRKGRSGERHIADTRSMIDKLVDHQGWTKISQINATGTNKFAAHLYELEASDRTVHSYLTAAKSFTRWLVKDGRLQSDPLAAVAKPNPSVDTKIKRRSLTHDEYRLLVETTSTAQEAYGMTGSARALLYEVAAQTGLRAGEIRELTRAKLYLDQTPAFVLIEKASTKNKQYARQYLQESTAVALKEHIAGMASGEPVFNLPTKWRMADMFRDDLARARHAWLEAATKPQERAQRERSDFLRDLDSQDQRLDFHALRHCLATWMIASGADVRTVQSVDASQHTAADSADLRAFDA